jgi:opacity protein-like surface antigen
MSKYRRLSLHLLVLICLTTLSAGLARAADFAIIIKSGTVSLWDNDQRLDMVERHFDNHSQSTLAVAWEIRTAKELALGMEYFTFRHDFSPPSTGRTKTQVAQFTVKKYFSPNRILHPYAGIGLGWGHAKYDDGQGNIDRDINFAMQASAGIEFRIGDNFGLYTEVKGLASGTDGEDENEFDFSGTGFLAGISIIF